MSEIPADELLRRSEAALRAENETLRKMATDLQDEQITLRAENAALRERVKNLRGALDLRQAAIDSAAIALRDVENVLGYPQSDFRG